MALLSHGMTIQKRKGRYHIDTCPEVCDVIAAELMPIPCLNRVEERTLLMATNF